MTVWSQALLDEKPTLDTETVVPSDNLPVAVEGKVFLCEYVGSRIFAKNVKSVQTL
jgi:hypothetical protein